MAKLLFVSGHRTDDRHRLDVRFPETRVDQVRAEIGGAFADWGVGPSWTLLTGGARGTDLLAANEALRLGARALIVLAMPPDKFIRRSVATDHPQPAAAGAGLAAQQVGVDLAVFIYDCPDENWARSTGVVCNPHVELPEGRDRRLVTWEEGCLSLPGANVDLSRPDVATCLGFDQYGDPVVITAGGTLGRCLQHETDHTRGIVFGDRLPTWRRKQLHRIFDQIASNYPDDWPQSPSR